MNKLFYGGNTLSYVASLLGVVAGVCFGRETLADRVSRTLSDIFRFPL